MEALGGEQGMRESFGDMGGNWCELVEMFGGMGYNERDSLVGMKKMRDYIGR